MQRYSFIRFLFAIAVLVLPFLTDLKEPAKKFLFGRYDLRYLLPDDLGSRIQTFAIRNAGDATAEPFRLDFLLEDGSIADFECSHFKTGPRSSYISTLEGLPLVAQIANDDQRSAIGRSVDEHAGDLRTLSGIQTAWTDLLVSRLQALAPDAASPPQTQPVVFSDIIRQHPLLVRSCPSSRPDACRNEWEIERWERTAAALRAQADSAWQKATGVNVAFDQGQFIPTKVLTFWLDPGPGSNDADFIVVHYGDGHLKATADFSQLPSSAIKVASIDDLYLSTIGLIWRYSRVQAIASLACLVAALIIAYPLLTPYSKMPTEKVFRLALTNPGDRRIWEALYEKIRDILVDDFRASCLSLGKPNVNLSAPELFDHLKNRMMVEFRTFSSSSELERYLNTQMRELALHA